MIHQLLELYSNQQRPTYLHIDMVGRSPHLPMNGVCAGVSSRHYPALPCPTTLIESYSSPSPSRSLSSKTFIVVALKLTYVPKYVVVYQGPSTSPTHPLRT